MQEPRLSHDAVQWIATLREPDIVHTAVAEDFDRITRITQRLREPAREFQLGPESDCAADGTGIAFCPDHGQDRAALIGCIDHAMYDAASSGINNFVIYSDP